MSFMRVKNGFFPFALKNPTDGSIIIWSLSIPNFLAIFRLSFSNIMVLNIFPVTIDGVWELILLFLEYAPMIMGNPDSATTQAILESYFSPVMSFRQSTSRLMASLATADLGV